MQFDDHNKVNKKKSEDVVDVYDSKRPSPYVEIHPWRHILLNSFVFLESGPAIFVIFVTSNVLSRTTCYHFDGNL